MKKLLFFLLAATILDVAGQQRQTENVVIITFDGLRWKELFRGADSALLFDEQFITKKNLKIFKDKYWANSIQERREKLMPFFWKTIAKEGQIYGNRDHQNFVNVKNPYWFSYPGYNEMFTGYPDTAVNSNDYPPNPHVTVQEFIHNTQPAYKGKVAAFTSWDAFNRILNKERCGFLVNAGYDDMSGDGLNPLQAALNTQQHLMPKIFALSERMDAVTFLRVTDYMKQKHPKILQFSMIDTDALAHMGKYDLYLDAAHSSDAMIAQIWKIIQSDPFYKDKTSLYIAVDHGRGDGPMWKNHGAKIEHADEIWFAVMGPDTKPAGEIKTSDQLYQNQHAKTIAALLGFDFKSPNPIGPVITSVVGK